MSGATTDLTPAQRERLGERLQAGCAALGIGPTAAQHDQLIDYLQLLVRWNRAYNLTAVRDPDEMVVRHLLDSLAVLPHLCGERVLDLGTGPGLPGLVLAIVAPACRVRLLDSNGKKVRFVRQAVLELGLANAEPVQARIETYRPGEKFSTIVSRAVAATDVLRVRETGLLDSPGRLLLMRAHHPEVDTAELPTEPFTVHRLQVPFLDGPRHLIAIEND
ncbi:16S rRNA (guanine(527)-N(7))-methyltransferase RsmG [Marichromatium bheemlicum]|uniref:Ribosomal RNA small subunit methyltransferase G n=1 Tax=Marichromatium bheemlicum TaxID=365339 RepID=A0ABX1I7N3_9GAMM|nr:16S rRNA (guanine(527)-N(7))-methyltransferase RsmG [Marichromatium bheemlicum]NKN32929.1 16S rRNA (guanine(527)-N(7))-methyltransferase RsmG [Marichromatium bheemlicum]